MVKVVLVIVLSMYKIHIFSLGKLIKVRRLVRCELGFGAKVKNQNQNDNQNQNR